MRFFYPGLHQLSHAQHFERCFLSVNRLRRRKSWFTVKKWIMDSGAFTEIATHGDYRHPVKAYAEEASRWEGMGQLELIVSQDYMCEEHMLKITGMTVRQHQKKTIGRYVKLLDCGLRTPIMPVLQGYTREEYLRHLEDYGDLLAPRQRVGVGSVCKRNSKPEQVFQVLSALKKERPDLRFHGFGLKITALGDPRIRKLLYSSDSMAWSHAARYEGRDQNDWREAQDYVRKIEAIIHA